MGNAHPFSPFYLLTDLRLISYSHQVAFSCNCIHISLFGRETPNRMAKPHKVLVIYRNSFRGRIVTLHSDSMIRKYTHSIWILTLSLRFYYFFFLTVLSSNRENFYIFFAYKSLPRSTICLERTSFSIRKYTQLASFFLILLLLPLLHWLLLLSGCFAVAIVAFHLFAIFMAFSNQSAQNPASSISHSNIHDWNLVQRFCCPSFSQKKTSMQYMYSSRLAAFNTIWYGFCNSMTKKNIFTDEHGLKEENLRQMNLYRILYWLFDLLLVVFHKTGYLIPYERHLRWIFQHIIGWMAQIQLVYSDLCKSS